MYNVHRPSTTQNIFTALLPPKTSSLPHNSPLPPPPPPGDIITPIENHWCIRTTVCVLRPKTTGFGFWLVVHVQTDWTDCTRCTWLHKGAALRKDQTNISSDYCCENYTYRKTYGFLLASRDRCHIDGTRPGNASSTWLIIVLVHWRVYTFEYHRVVRIVLSSARTSALSLYKQTRARVRNDVFVVR